MSRSILNDRLSKEQLILSEIYTKNLDEPTTIEELAEKLHMPRTTLVQHLNSLEEAGFIRAEKQGRVINYFPVEGIATHMQEALEKLQSAYAYALTFIQRKRLKELEDYSKESGAKR